MPTETEGDLIFSFDEDAQIERFDDDKTHGMNHYQKGMKRVDFVVTFPTVTWLIEVKDPENSNIPTAHKSNQKASFRNKMRSETLYRLELAPKLKDSLVYLVLANRAPEKSIKYICIIGIEKLDSAMLANMQDRMRKLCFLPGPHSRDWTSKFDVIVVNLSEWNQKITGSTVRRKS